MRANLTPSETWLPSETVHSHSKRNGKHQRLRNPRSRLYTVVRFLSGESLDIARRSAGPATPLQSSGFCYSLPASFLRSKQACSDAIACCQLTLLATEKNQLRVRLILPPCLQPMCGDELLCQCRESGRFCQYRTSSGWPSHAD